MASRMGPADADRRWRIAQEDAARRFGGDPARDSFADVLHRLRALYPSALLDGSGWRRLIDRVAEIPAAAVRVFYLEFRLGDPSPSADFFLSVPPNSPEALYYVRRGAQAVPGSPAGELARYLTELARDDSPLFRWSPRAFVAYDVIEPPAAAVGDPGVYVGVRHEPLDGGGDPRGAARAGLASTLGRVVGWNEEGWERPAVERAYDALPPSGWFKWAGAIPGRTERSIRLVAKGVAAAEAPALLERLRWPGPIRRVAALLEELHGRYTPDAMVSFNVAEGGLLPPVGLELAVGTPPVWMTTQAAEWRPLFDLLVENDWCHPARVRALLAWLGRERYFVESGPCLAYKGLEHVKLTIRADTAVSAKGYVCMAFAPIAAAASPAAVDGAGDEERNAGSRESGGED